MEFDSQKKIFNQSNPIDYIEEYVVNDNKDIFRESRDEITILSKGIWKDYNISFKWNDEKKIIEVNSYFDIFKKNRINKSIYSLVSNVNKKVNVGFFNFCSKLETIFFSYKISIKGQNAISFEQIQNFIDIVTNECDRFFPVFFVFFYKKQDPTSALDIALLDTCGEA
ncbi:MAG: YbjN domain-containing protein [Pseudomonadota bacterium]|nr:YbjN domain-containing protein [Pseudomonadota bacterium]